MVSVVVPLPEAALPWLSAAGAVAMTAAVEAATGATLLIEWPNDLVAGDDTADRGLRKLGGVLVETSSFSDVAVIGVGLNVDILAEEMPEELRRTAGSLLTVLGSRPDRRDILGRFLVEIERWAGLPGRLPDELARLSATLGRDVTVGEGARLRRGRALGFDDHMRLLVRMPDGTVEAVSTPAPAGRAFAATKLRSPQATQLRRRRREERV
jgi:BirA family biotin operon repressor/biotin-[acetyl-CoA-carboxylase] ligase